MVYLNTAISQKITGMKSEKKNKTALKQPPMILRNSLAK